jgi:putative ABC transport system ATP-binding protein
MGPSGSGKSSLMHLLAGLDESDDGEVVLGGRRLSQIEDDQVTLIRRRHVGFVFQFFNLLPMMTAFENIALPLLLDGTQFSDYAPRVEEVLEMVDLADRANHYPNQLSGGEQQRVAIARALITEPEILLADEPTGNLDSKAGDRLLQLLRRACAQQGQTIVIVTHDPFAASFADRILFLYDGVFVHEIQNQGLSIQAIVDLMAHLDG